MVLLEADAFLTQLTRILEKSKSVGTIYITMKKRMIACTRLMPLRRSTHGAVCLSRRLTLLLWFFPPQTSPRMAPPTTPDVWYARRVES